MDACSVVQNPNYHALHDAFREYSTIEKMKKESINVYVIKMFFFTWLCAFKRSISRKYIHVPPSYWAHNILRHMDLKQDNSRKRHVKALRVSFIPVNNPKRFPLVRKSSGQFNSTFKHNTHTKANIFYLWVLIHWPGFRRNTANTPV